MNIIHCNLIQFFPIVYLNKPIYYLCIQNNTSDIKGFINKFKMLTFIKWKEFSISLKWRLFKKISKLELFERLHKKKRKEKEKRDVRGAFNKFPDFFCTGIWNCRRHLKIQYLIAIHLMRWLAQMISGSNEQLQQQLEYTLLKPDCHSWWISKLQSGREDTLEEQYAIKFCFKLEENARETYGMLQTAFGAFCMNRASFFEWHERFKEGRESLRDDERCGRNKEVNTPELIGQRVRVTMLRF